MPRSQGQLRMLSRKSKRHEYFDWGAEVSIESHPMLLTPSTHAKIWRYMSFTKFVSLLQMRASYFANLEHLATSDPYEGLLAEPNYSHRRYGCIDDMDLDERSVARIDELGIPEEIRNLRFLGYLEQQEEYLKRTFAMRRSYFVNCWYMKNTSREAAMWAIYGGHREGIAISSNSERVGNAFRNSQERIFLSEVKYIDYVVERIAGGNSFFPVIHKRLDFEHEQEMRIIYWDTDVTHRTELVHSTSADADTSKSSYRMKSRSLEEMESMPMRTGLYIDCDIDQLIEQVHLSPGFADWFYNLVQSVTKKYKLECEIKRSKVDAKPKR